MGELLAVLCFGLLIGAQFLAVIAVHRLKGDGLPSRADASETPGLAQRDLHALAERLHASHASRATADGDR